jgi:hypothetical protein
VTSSAPETDPLQTALAAEHAAVYEYGVLGAATSASAAPEQYAAVGAAYRDHRDQRDELTAMIREAGGTPVAAEAAYEIPDVRTGAQVDGRAVEIEQACQETYAWVVAGTSGAERHWAVDALQRSAVRVLAFRGSPEIFPGASEYADR